MPVADPHFARSNVLRMFGHAQVYLFLGAAIITVGPLAALFSLLRRRFDPLLLWFALFAILYGLRLEMNYQMLWALHLRPVIFLRLVRMVGYLIPIPAFFFFRMLDILVGAGRLVRKSCGLWCCSSQWRRWWSALGISSATSTTLRSSPR